MSFQPLLPQSSLLKTRTTRRGSEDVKVPINSLNYAASGRELTVYILLALWVATSSMIATWNLSREEGLNYQMYEWKLEKGYLFGRKMVTFLVE